MPATRRVDVHDQPGIGGGVSGDLRDADRESPGLAGGRRDWRDHDARPGACARELEIPLVNLATTLPDAGLPRVSVDHKAIGRLAADHLLDCGLRRFAYWGLSDVWYSHLRGNGFVERLAEAGYRCELLERSRRHDPSQSLYGELQKIGQWLETLEVPIGVPGGSRLSSPTAGRRMPTRGT